MLVLREKSSWSVLVFGCDFHCRREMSTFPRPMARAARRGKAEDCSSSGPVTEPRYHGAYKNRSRQICARREGEVAERNSLRDRPPLSPVPDIVNLGIPTSRATQSMHHHAAYKNRSRQSSPGETSENVTVPGSFLFFI